MVGIDSQQTIEAERLSNASAGETEHQAVWEGQQGREPWTCSDSPNFPDVCSWWTVCGCPDIHSTWQRTGSALKTSLVLNWPIAFSQLTDVREVSWWLFLSGCMFLCDSGFIFLCASGRLPILTAYASELVHGRTARRMSHWLLVDPAYTAISHEGFGRSSPSRACQIPSQWLKEMPFVPKRWIVIPNCLIIIAVVVKFEAMYITSGSSSGQTQLAQLILVLVGPLFWRLRPTPLRPTLLVLQEQDDGTIHPVAYASHSLNKHKKNYGISEVETLGLVWAVCYLQPYILYSEHVACLSIVNTDKPSGKLAHWALMIQELNTSQGKKIRLQMHYLAMSRWLLQWPLRRILLVSDPSLTPMLQNLTDGIYSQQIRRLHGDLSCMESMQTVWSDWQDSVLWAEMVCCSTPWAEGRAHEGSTWRLLAGHLSEKKVYDELRHYMSGGGEWGLMFDVIAGDVLCVWARGELGDLLCI